MKINKRDIAIYNLEGKRLFIVKDLHEARQFTNITKNRIVDCLHNRRNFSGEYQFRYKYAKDILKRIMPII